LKHGLLGHVRQVQLLLTPRVAFLELQHQRGDLLFLAAVIARAGRVDTALLVVFVLVALNRSLVGR
jgi:hypothetical protein